MKLFNFLASAVLMSIFTSVNAQKFCVEDFVVNANGTTTVNFYLDPEGLSLTNATICFTAPTGFTLSNAKYADGLYSSASTESCAIASTKLKVTFILQGANDIPTSKCLYGSVDLTAEETASNTEMKLTSMAYKVVGGTNTKLPNGTVVCNVLRNVTLNESGYTTYSVCAPVVVSGAKVMGSELNGNTLTLTDKGTIIPANTGVILKGDGVATFEPSAETAVVPSALSAAVLNTTVSANSVLTLSQGDKAFYLYTGTEIPANKAYLELPSAQNSRIRIVENEATGIQNINAEGLNINYNLMGHQVKAQKGIVIENGKKAIKF